MNFAQKTLNLKKNIELDFAISQKPQLWVAMIFFFVFIPTTHSAQAVESDFSEAVIKWNTKCADEGKALEKKYEIKKSQKKNTVCAQSTSVKLDYANGDRISAKILSIAGVGQCKKTYQAVEDSVKKFNKERNASCSDILRQANKLRKCDSDCDSAAEQVQNLVEKKKNDFEEKTKSIFEDLNKNLDLEDTLLKLVDEDKSSVDKLNVSSVTYQESLQDYSKLYATEPQCASKQENEQNEPCLAAIQNKITSYKKEHSEARKQVKQAIDDMQKLAVFQDITFAKSTEKERDREKINRNFRTAFDAANNATKLYHPNPTNTPTIPSSSVRSSSSGSSLIGSGLGATAILGGLTAASQFSNGSSNSGNNSNNKGAGKNTNFDSPTSSPTSSKKNTTPLASKDSSSATKNNGTLSSAENIHSSTEQSASLNANESKNNNSSEQLSSHAAISRASSGGSSGEENITSAFETSLNPKAVKKEEPSESGEITSILSQMKSLFNLDDTNAPSDDTSPYNEGAQQNYSNKKFTSTNPDEDYVADGTAEPNDSYDPNEAHAEINDNAQSENQRGSRDTASMGENPNTSLFRRVHIFLSKCATNSCVTYSSGGIR